MGRFPYKEDDMKTLVFAVAAAALVSGCAMYAPPAEMSAQARSQLAEEIGARVAGPKQNCVRSADLRSSRSIDERTIVFDGPSGSIYVNRPRDGCPMMGRGRAIRTQSTSAQLCSGDIVQVFDPLTGIDYGSCALGEFTHYRRN
jgi:hypothetical protein